MSAKVENSDSRLSLHHDSVLATAAMLYYKESLTQNEIALRLGVSRPTVINYLRLAREQKIVDIRINGAAFTASNLSRELREKFKLKDVYVADFAPDPESENYKAGINRHVARVGAMALHDILQPGDLVGVAWGETMQFLSEDVPYRLIENLTVCQLIGSMSTPLVSAAESVAIRISSRLAAECFTLHAPAVLSTPELAEALRQEPAIRNQLEKLGFLDRAIFSVGNCDSDTPMVQMAITNKDEFDWYRNNGAVGVLCGYFIDKNGQHVKGPVDNRMIGVTLDQVRATGAGILVAGGVAKFNAIQATLNGGYVSHLVTDDLTARRLLDNVGAAA
ncbi:MAG: sugar-binding transcriptional regulator [Stappiaceae bacterium]